MYNQKNEAIMYIENDDFSVWMQKLYAKLEELCKDVRVLRNADRVLPEDDNLLDNQDLCLLFKVSIKTLQRYRAIGALPYFTISGKVYYKASDVREFIKVPTRNSSGVVSSAMARRMRTSVEGVEVARSIQERYFSPISAISSTVACFNPSCFRRWAMRLPISL